MRAWRIELPEFRRRILLTHLDPASTLAFGLLVFSLIMVILFEATAWLLTLPVTIVFAGGIYYLLADPEL